MKLLPYALLRIAGGSFEEIKSLLADSTGETIEQIIKEKAKLSLLRLELEKSIYKEISFVENPKEQQLLLNLKRAIFNIKDISRQIILATKISPLLSEKLNEYNDVYQLINSLTIEGNDRYNEDLSKIRESLKRLASNECVQNGLLLSSKTLLNEVNKYLSKSPNSFKKKENQVEIGLTKYIFRIYTKTSPFSTFTNLSTIKVTEDTKSTIEITRTNELNPVTSFIRLNNFIFRYLQALIKKTKEIYIWLPFKLNPTIKLLNGEYHFLINSYNIESFQRIKSDEILTLLKDTVNFDDSMTYNKLCDSIMENEYIDATRNDIESHVYSLVEYGFFEFDFIASGCDPDWDIKFVEVLKNIENSELVSKLIHTLKFLRELANDYELSNTKRRKDILETAFQELKSTCFEIHKAANLPEHERSLTSPIAKKTEKKENSPFIQITPTFFTFREENIFLEDTLANLNAKVNKKQISEVVLKMDALLGNLQLFENEEAQQRLKGYFEGFLDKNSEINIIDFYRDYHVELQKNFSYGKDNLQLQNENTILEKEETHIEDNSTFHEQMKTKWENIFGSQIKLDSGTANGCIEINLPDIKKINNLLKLDVKKLNTSFSMFSQFYMDKDTNNKPMLMCVMNSVSPGFGKMISRFLYLLDHNVINSLKTYNELFFDKNELLIENTDSNFFNANLHPPFLPYELKTPGSQNMLTPDHHISVNDIFVCYDSINNELVLKHKPTNKKVNILNTGLQTIDQRSLLFRLIDSFSKVKNIHYFPIAKTINSRTKFNKTTSNIVILPRIIYGHQIILQRKSWLIPKAILPLRDNDETDWLYFLRINEWVHNNSIPSEVFIVIAMKSQIANSEYKLNRDDYKPQYINFINPLLVNVFERSLSKVPEYLKIEEMLPTSEQILKVNNQPYVTEFVTQWYST